MFENWPEIEGRSLEARMRFFDDCFVEKNYLAANRDVEKSIANHTFKSGKQHWDLYGKREVALGARSCSQEHAFYKVIRNTLFEAMSGFFSPLMPETPMDNREAVILVRVAQISSAASRKVMSSPNKSDGRSVTALADGSHSEQGRKDG